MSDLSLEIDGRRREVLVSLPSAPTGTVPLVLVFHGAGATAAMAQANTGWGAVAARTGMIALFPEGTRRDPDRAPAFRQNPQAWNDGSGRGHVARAQVDDVGFTRALLDEAAGRWPVDPTRIYATGFSNGASMVFRVAAELSERFAAVAPVAGHLWATDSPPQRPVPLMLVSGGADPLNPLDGGTVETPWGASEYHPPILDSARRWAEWSRCDPEPRPLPEPAGIRTLVWTGADPRAEVRATIVEELGHAWPGGRRLLPEWIGGRSSDRLDGTRVTREFLLGHHL